MGMYLCVGCGSELRTTKNPSSGYGSDGHKCEWVEKDALSKEVRLRLTELVEENGKDEVYHALWGSVGRGDELGKTATELLKMAPNELVAEEWASLFERK